MTVAILALQGAFAEHQQMLRRLGVDSILIRNLQDWQNYLYNVSPTGGDLEGAVAGAGLIIPGGESTAMMRIIKDEGLYEPIRKAILEGMPVFGTCAGLIMLDKDHLDTMDINVKRNAYGRQLGSFHTEGHILHITDSFPDEEGRGGAPMTFIRAPYIESVATPDILSNRPPVEVLSVVDNHIVAARQGNQLVTAFHPELDDDTRVHEYFLSMVQGK